MSRETALCMTLCYTMSPRARTKQRTKSRTKDRTKILIIHEATDCATVVQICNMKRLTLRSRISLLRSRISLLRNRVSLLRSGISLLRSRISLLGSINLAFWEGGSRQKGPHKAAQRHAQPPHKVLHKVNPPSAFQTSG